MQGENLPYRKCCIQLTGPRHNRVIDYSVGCTRLTPCVQMCFILSKRAEVARAVAPCFQCVSEVLVIGVVQPIPLPRIVIDGVIKEFFGIVRRQLRRPTPVQARVLQIHIKSAHACCMTVIRGSLSQAFDSGLNGSLCLLILGILRLVLNFSPYRCAKSGSVFRHERKTERGPPLLVNVVRTGPLDGIDTWILSCTFRFPPFL